MNQIFEREGGGGLKIVINELTWGRMKNPSVDGRFDIC
jgi:hypothetical protein